ncbi:TrmH family RNA methyltransferase [candidate division KSB1 bacterium]
METLSKNRLAQLRKFLQKKHRKAARCALIEGEKLLGEALAHGFSIETLVYTQGSGKRFRDIIGHTGIGRSYRADTSTITKLSELETGPGILGLVRYPGPAQRPGENPEHTRYIFLDRISDPSNLGTIIRTASWYGWDGIICGTGCVELLNGKVLRASMGALFHLPVWEDADPEHTLKALKSAGFTLYGSVPRGGEQTANRAERTVIIIGNETEGIRTSILRICDHLLTIPGQGKAESLNAAVCAGIIMDRFSVDIS